MCVLSDRDIEYELQRGYLRIDGCPCLGQISTLQQIGRAHV